MHWILCVCVLIEQDHLFSLHLKGKLEKDTNKTQNVWSAIQETQNTRAVVRRDHFWLRGITTSRRDEHFHNQLFLRRRKPSRIQSVLLPGPTADEEQLEFSRLPQMCPLPRLTKWTSLLALTSFSGGRKWAGRSWTDWSNPARDSFSWNWLNFLDLGKNGALRWLDFQL